MKIGILSHSLSRLNGGITEVVRRNCEALRAQGDHEIHVFAPRDKYSETDRHAYAGVALHPIKSYGPQRFPFTPGATRELLGADLDILHVHGVWNSHVRHALQWRKRTGRPLFVTPHGQLEPWTFGTSPVKKRIISSLFQDDLFRAASCIQASTETEAREVARLYPGKKVSVIANCVPLVTEVPEGKPGWWAPAHGGRKVFVYLGRIHPKKGMREMCAAWRTLCDTQSGFRDDALLVICGWASRMPDFDALIDALVNDTGNVVYAGPQYGNDKWRTFAAADYLLLPSKSEGLPMAVLDAWSTGLPSIMTTECNLPVGFEQGAAIECGQSADSIARAIRGAMAESPGEHKARAAAAKHLIATTFSAETISSELLRMYTGPHQ